MNMKTDNTFNDPFCVRIFILIFKVGWKILKGKKIQKVVKVLLISNEFLFLGAIVFTDAIFFSPDSLV